MIESINHFLDTQTYPKENTTSQWLPHNCPKKTWLRCSRCRSTLSCPIKSIAQRYMPYSRSWSAILLMSTMPSPYSILTQNRPQRIRTFQQCLLLRLRCHPSPPHDGKPEYQHRRIKRHQRRNQQPPLPQGTYGTGILLCPHRFGHDCLIFEMFQEIAPRLSGSDLAKAAEMELLKENIYTEYMEEIVCYCKRRTIHRGTAKNASAGWAHSTAAPYWHCNNFR